MSLFLQGAVLSAEFKPRNGYKPTQEETATKKVVSGSKVWRNPKIELKDLHKPKPGPRDVLLRIKACGICGSDVHMYEHDNEGYILYPGLTKFPTVTGHELAGQIEEVGKEVKGLEQGDLVCCEEMIWCGYCTPCRNGLPNHCENLEEIGFTINGGFEEYLTIGSKYCWKIDSLTETYRSEDKACEAGSLVEPTSVAYHAMFTRAEGFKPGAYVVVYGAGPIGLGAIALAKAAGAGKVIVFEVSNERLSLVKELGADYTFNPVELAKKNLTPHDRVLEITGGAGADLQIEAAGAPTKTLPEMQKSLAVGGKVTWIGRADVLAPMFIEVFQTHGAQVYGSQGHSGHGNFQNVIRLMAAGKIDQTKIITKRYKLTQILEAMSQATKRVDAKITIKP
nr:scyllo-inosose 3-dehydrogenase [Candidatus Njordarchaeota archaeon]